MVWWTAINQIVVIGVFAVDAFDGVVQPVRLSNL